MLDINLDDPYAVKLPMLKVAKLYSSFPGLRLRRRTWAEIRDLLPAAQAWRCLYF